ncbi:hypothetical protein ABRG53_2249 [Pseudanabaena sp. ABRG5-3]|nr:hypothetical protein ABRG53_2249 [Pseudanabaena sp. ABRG5-3]
MGSVHVPLLEDMGSINKNAPRDMTAKKPRQIVLAGFTGISTNYEIIGNYNFIALALIVVAIEDIFSDFGRNMNTLCFVCHK